MENYELIRIAKALEGIKEILEYIYLDLISKKTEEEENEE